MIERGTLRWRMVASGASNHAKVGWAGLCKGLGNADLLGIEAHHDNLSEPWSEAAFDGYARGVAAICRHLDINEQRVALHREHQPGDKSDPTFDGPAFRARVAHHLGSGEDDMQATGRDIHPDISNAQALRDVWDRMVADRNRFGPGGDIKLLEVAAAKLDHLVAAAAADEVRDRALEVAVEALAAAIRAGGGIVDTAPILARINVVAAQAQAQVAALQGEVARAREAERAAAAALADALGAPETVEPQR
jgi:hypothetical protein